MFGATENTGVDSTERRKEQKCEGYGDILDSVNIRGAFIGSTLGTTKEGGLSRILSFRAPAAQLGHGRVAVCHRGLGQPHLGLSAARTDEPVAEHADRRDALSLRAFTSGAEIRPGRRDRLLADPPSAPSNSPWRKSLQSPPSGRTGRGRSSFRRLYRVSDPPLIGPDLTAASRPSPAPGR